MSLQPCIVSSVPELTANVARSAFPKGNPYLRLRDELGSIFRDEDFRREFPDLIILDPASLLREMAPVEGAEET